MTVKKPSKARQAGGVEPVTDIVMLWAKAPRWSVEEGVALAFGADPRRVIRQPTTGYDDAHLNLSDTARHYADLAHRAVREGDLSKESRPADFVVWAESVGLAFHPIWKEVLGLEVGGSDQNALSESHRRFWLISRWAKMHLWTAREAACLSLNVCPDDAVDPEHLRDHGQLRKDLEHRLRYAERDPALKEQDTPETFLAWAKRSGFPFHPNWAEAIIKHEPKSVEAEEANVTEEPTERALPTRERTSLLKLVIGMAVKGYSYDPSEERSKVTGEILDDLDELGLSLDRKTLRKYLDEGAELLPRDSETE